MDDLFSDSPHDWEMIDVILVSNTNSLTHLPCITENSGFRGKILATEPVLRLGKVIIDDMFYEVEALSLPTSETRTSERSGTCLPLYTRDQAANSLSKVQTVAYHEFVDVFGLLKVKCMSAGYEIGSCNWIIKTDSEKLSFLSRSSLFPSFAMPMDFSELTDCDVIIVGSVCTDPAPPIEKTINLFKTVAVQSLARGGHVLVPVLPSGTHIFHIFEAIAAVKDEFNGNLIPAFDQRPACGHPHSQPTQPSSSMSTAAAVPMSSTSEGDSTSTANTGGVSLMGKVTKSPIMFISSEGKASLAYANASGEWLAPSRESALYTAESPFPFDTWVRNGHLSTLTSLHSTSPGHQTPSTGGGGDAVAEGGYWPPTSPCVFLTGHPSCRFGPAVHLIRALSRLPHPTKGAKQTERASANAIILVQSDDFTTTDGSTSAQMSSILSPFLPSTRGCKNGEDATPACSRSADVLGIPTCQLGAGASVYWLPLRFDVTLEQLPSLLAKCGLPKQALVLPTEVDDPGSVLPYGLKAASVYQIGPGSAMTIELDERLLLPVHLDSPSLLSRNAYVVSVGDQPQAPPPSSSSSKADMRRTPSESHVNGQTLVALIDGQLCFRDGKYRLCCGASSSADAGGPLKLPVAPTEQQCRPSSPGPRPASPRQRIPSPPPPPTPPPPTQQELSATQPTQPPPGEEEEKKKKKKRKRNAAAAGGGVDCRILLSLRTAIDPSKLVKQLTESGVTGGQIITEVGLVTNFIDTQCQKVPLLADLKLLDDDKCALIVFPDSTTTVLLSEKGSHISCQDDSTRQAIRNSIISCAEMTTVPASHPLTAAVL